MWTYGLRAVPWGLVLVGSALLTVLLMLVAYDPWRLWPLQGIAVGVLAAVSCWCLDEQAAGVVDAAPRGILWRTMARLSGVVPPLVVWLVMVWRARGSLFGHSWEVALQGVAAVLVSLAWGTARRCGGSTTPGQRWGAVVVPLVTAWALVRPAERRLPVFPYGPQGHGGSWGTSAAGWSVAGAAALGLLIVLLLGDGRLPVRRPHGGAGPVAERTGGAPG